MYKQVLPTGTQQNVWRPAKRIHINSDVGTERVQLNEATKLIHHCCSHLNKIKEEEEAFYREAKRIQNFEFQSSS